MPVNYFKSNRVKVQQSLYDTNFIKAITNCDLPLEIEEKKAQPGKLRYVNLNNIPVGDDNYPRSWEINIEIENSLLSLPQYFKPVDRIIAFFTCESLFIVLIELKNSIYPYDKESGLNAIKKKLIDSIGKIKLTFPIYQFDSKIYDEIKIKYLGLIVYNNDKVTYSALEDIQLQNDEMFKVFSGQKKFIFLIDSLNNSNEKLEMKFIHNNSGNPESADIDFCDIFNDSSEFDNAQYSDFTCP